MITRRKAEKDSKKENYMNEMYKDYIQNSNIIVTSSYFYVYTRDQEGKIRLCNILLE